MKINLPSSYTSIYHFLKNNETKVIIQNHNDHKCLYFYYNNSIYYRNLTSTNTDITIVDSRKFDQAQFKLMSINKLDDNIINQINNFKNSNKTLNNVLTVPISSSISYGLIEHKPPLIRFTNDNGTLVGELNIVNNHLNFKGDLDDSAFVFFNYISKLVDSKLTEIELNIYNNIKNKINNLKRFSFVNYKCCMSESINNEGKWVLFEDIHKLSSENNNG